MPVYERGGQTSEDMFIGYKEAVDSVLTVGEPTFRDLLKLLTKKGETKAGLSGCYIRLRHFGKTFGLTMLRIVEPGKYSSGNEITDRVQTFLSECAKIQQFV